MGTINQIFSGVKDFFKQKEIPITPMAVAAPEIKPVIKMRRSAPIKMQTGSVIKKAGRCNKTYLTQSI